MHYDTDFFVNIVTICFPRADIYMYVYIGKLEDFLHRKIIINIENIRLL